MLVFILEPDFSAKFLDTSSRRFENAASDPLVLCSFSLVVDDFLCYKSLFLFILYDAT